MCAAHCLSPSNAKDMSASPETILEILDSIRGAPESDAVLLPWETDNPPVWTPKLLALETTLMLEDILRKLVCLAVSSVNSGTAAYYIEVIGYLIPKLACTQEWRMQSGQKFIVVIVQMISSFNIFRYNINPFGLPWFTKACLFRCTLSVVRAMNLGEKERYMFKIYSILKELLPSTLIQCCGSNNRDCLKWFCDYCVLIQYFMDSQLRFRHFEPESMCCEMVKACCAAALTSPAWLGWDLMWVTLKKTLEMNPKYCKAASDGILEPLHALLFEKEVPQSVRFVLIDLFGMLSMYQTGEENCWFPKLPPFMDDNSKCTAFIEHTLLPLSIAQSAFSNLVEPQHGWQWMVEFCLEFMERDPEADDVAKTLLVLQVILLHGNHNCDVHYSRISLQIMRFIMEGALREGGIGKAVTYFVRFVIQQNSMLAEYMKGSLQRNLNSHPKFIP